jgi:hypothetical protein
VREGVRVFVALFDEVAPDDRVGVGVSVIVGVPVGVGLLVGVPVGVGVAVDVVVGLGVGVDVVLGIGPPFSFIRRARLSAPAIKVNGVDPQGSPVGPRYPAKPY